MRICNRLVATAVLSAAFISCIVSTASATSPLMSRARTAILASAKTEDDSGAWHFLSASVGSCRSAKGYAWNDPAHKRGWTSLEIYCKAVAFNAHAEADGPWVPADPHDIGPLIDGKVSNASAGVTFIRRRGRTILSRVANLRFGPYFWNDEVTAVWGASNSDTEAQARAKALAWLAMPLPKGG